MKNLYLLIIAAVLFAACKQQSKTVTEKLISVSAADSMHKPSADTLKKAVLNAPLPAMANDTIIPGERIGRISLGERTEDLIKVLGKPDSSDAAMGKALLKWFSKPTRKGADTTVHSIMIFTATNFGGKDEASRVKHIRITSPFFKTAEGIGCGSTVAFIKLQYPQLKKPSASYTDAAGNTVMIYDDKEAGISFEIGASTKCIGVTVHEPGEKSWETYITEFGDVERE